MVAGTAYSYDASGHVTGFNFGNSVTGTYSYAPNRSQLASLSYAKGSQALFGLSYRYQQDSTNCPNGNGLGNNNQIQCINDSVDSGRTASYTYDAVGRLGTATTNGSTSYPQWGVSQTYDRYGNRWTQTVTAGTGPPSSLTFSNSGGALTNHPDGWCFDASGNLLAKSGTLRLLRISSTTGENRMVADPVAGATYVYDGNGTRIQKCLPNCTSPTSSTMYLYSGSQDIAEYDNGVAPSLPSREFIYSDAIPGSGLLASVVAGTTTYFQSDHLSWRVSTNSSGQILGQQGSFPFGESWYSSNGNEFIFTSYQRDAESGLDYAMARYYDSTVARFCSADPLGGSPEDPQSWNRYPYGRNDPIDITDPSGKSWWSSLLIDFGVAVAMYFAPEIERFIGNEFGIALGDSDQAILTARSANYGAQLAPLITRSAAQMTATAAGDAAAATSGGLGSALAGAGAATAAQANGDRPKPKQQGQAPTAPPTKDCPPVPSHPKGASVNANIGDMEDVKAADQTKNKTIAWGWFINKVAPHHPWDYKDQPPGYMAYDDFGNFNYGATGAVLTNSFQTLVNGAVLARLSHSPLAQLKNYGVGNSPHKNEMIRQGMQYYQNHCGTL